MKKRFIHLLFLFCTLNASAQTTIYVDSAATGMNNGTSWANAYNELSDALHYAWQTPLVDSVLVAKGTYEPGHRAYDMQPNKIGVEVSSGDTVFHIRTGLNVIGGFQSNGNIDPIDRNCILQGKQPIVVLIDSSNYWNSINDTSVLNNFTVNPLQTISSIGVIANGNNYSWHIGIHIYSALSKIVNIEGSFLSGNGIKSLIQVERCSFYNLWDPVQFENSNFTFINCTIDSCYGYWANGGISTLGNADYCIIENSVFNNLVADNYAGLNLGAVDSIILLNNTLSKITAYNVNNIFSYVGGLYTGGSYAHIKKNIFTECNAITSSGAMSVSSTKSIIEENVFQFCTSDNGVISLNSTTSRVANNLFAGSGDGVINLSTDTLEFINNTMFQNINFLNPNLFFGLSILNAVDLSNRLTISNNIFYTDASNLYSTGFIIDIAVLTNLSNLGANINGNYFSDNDFASNVSLPNNFGLPYGNPKFIDPSNLKGPDGIWMTADDGLRLDTNSLALNAGLNSAVPASVTSDIKGDNRIYGTAVDIGAYENQSVFFPIPQINAGPAASAMNQQFLFSLCSTISNTTLGLNNPPAGASIWSVINPGNINVAYNAVDSTIIFPTPAVGTYSLSVFYANASDTSKLDTIFVVSPVTPNITITNTSSLSICQGDSIGFMVNVMGGTASNYQWQLNGVNVGNNNSSYTLINAASNDSINCIVTYTNPCITGSATQASNVLIAIVNALPSISITSSPSDSICVGDSLSLTASGASNYSWSGGISNGMNFSPSVTTTYTVTATDINSCSNTSTQQVVVNALPTISVTSNPSDTICIGDSLSLTASGANSYSWSGGISNGLNFSPSTTGMYTVTATDINSCSNTSTQQVVVNTLPSISITSSPSDTICAGDSLSITASGASNYSWSGGISNGMNFSPSVTTTYTVTATDINSCSNTSTQQVVVNPLPTVQANASDTTICASDSLTLFGSGANMYSWTNGVLDNIAFIPAVSQSYLVTGTDNNNCSNIDSIFIQVDSNQNPSVSLVSTPNPAPILQSILFTANVPASITNYQIDWYVNGSINTTTVSPNNTFNYTANVFGDSIWCVLHAIGCYAPDSASSNILGFVAPDGIQDYSSGTLQIYPNPASTQLIVRTEKELIEEIILVDVFGNTISRKQVNNAKQVNLSLGDIANGHYHLLIQTAKGRVIRKVQVLR